MSEVKHTPTPWKSRRDGKNKIILIEGDNTQICELTGKEAEMGFDYEAPFVTVQANAAFIVKAVNCHDELVDLLTIAIDFRKNPEGVGYEEVKAFIETAEKALAKAKGAA